MSRELVMVSPCINKRKLKRSTSILQDFFSLGIKAIFLDDLKKFKILLLKRCVKMKCIEIKKY